MPTAGTNAVEVLEFLILNDGLRHHKQHHPNTNTSLQYHRQSSTTTNAICIKVTPGSQASG